MRFLYKIYSGYDGFFPRRIPARMAGKNLLRLGWDRYLDVVEKGFEVWIYFHGPHAFQKGVYVKGFVHSIDPKKRFILLRIREYNTTTPLTDDKTTDQVAEIVKPKYRQVFLLPEEWITTPACTVGSTAESCKQRLCQHCPTWNRLPLIDLDSFSLPKRLGSHLSRFVPAYWVIPSRCYLGRQVNRKIRNTSEIFYRFKVGEGALAFPLALGIFEKLRHQNLLEFDAIIPIPLSPEKAKRGEINRTAVLAHELSILLGRVPVVNVLRLKSPFTKKLARARGATLKQYENEYFENLELDLTKEMSGRVLLLDDVCTHGSTLSIACRRILESNPHCEVVAATAGQMILKNVVRDKEGIIAN